MMDVIATQRWRRTLTALQQRLGLKSELDAFDELRAV